MRCCATVIRRPFLKQLEQVPDIGHLALDARMRPVAAPHQPFRIGRYQRLVKRPRIGIVGRILADAMRARQFCPAPPLADRAQQALETIRLGARARVGPSHVIDHHRQAKRFQNRNGPGQILDVDPELQVPSQLGHRRRKRLRGGERHAAAVMQLPVAEEMIEAQAAHAEIIPPPQRFRRDCFIGHRDAAQTIRLARQRIQHRRIVVAMRATLHQHAAIEADRVEHREIFCQRRIRRRIAAVIGVRKPRRRPEYMRVRIAGVRRRRHFRPGRLERRQAGGDHRLVRRVIRPSCPRP